MTAVAAAASEAPRIDVVAVRTGRAPIVVRTVLRLGGRRSLLTGSF
jgi:hypothetical protein